MVHPFNGLLFSCKKEWNSYRWHTMDELEKIMLSEISWTQEDKYYLISRTGKWNIDSQYKNRIGKFIETDSRLEEVRGWGSIDWWGIQNFHFGWWKSFWVVMVTQHCECIDATDLHTFKWLKRNILCYIYFTTIKKNSLEKISLLIWERKQFQVLLAPWLNALENKMET